MVKYPVVAGEGREKRSAGGASELQLGLLRGNRLGLACSLETALP